jgi:hypothetical protein
MPLMPRFAVIYNYIDNLYYVVLATTFKRMSIYKVYLRKFHS